MKILRVFVDNFISIKDIFYPNDSDLKIIKWFMPSLATAKLSIKTTYKDTLELSSSFFRRAAAMNRLISKDVVSQLQCVCYENILTFVIRNKSLKWYLSVTEKKMDKY